MGYLTHHGARGGKSLARDGLEVDLSPPASKYSECLSVRSSHSRRSIGGLEQEKKQTVGAQQDAGSVEILGPLPILRTHRHCESALPSLLPSTHVPSFLVIIVFSLEAYLPAREWQFEAGTVVVWSWEESHFGGKSWLKSGSGAEHGM